MYLTFVRSNLKPSTRAVQLLKVALVIYTGAPTTMNLNGTVTVQEGDSVNIACFSSGNPVPTISWYLRDSLAPFSQSDTVINLEAIVFQERPSDPPELRFTEGNITSVLQITNAVYPAHDGEYTCVGLNSNRAGNRTDNATITVQVQGKRVVVCTTFSPQHTDKKAMLSYLTLYTGTFFVMEKL